MKQRVLAVKLQGRLFHEKGCVQGKRGRREEKTLRKTNKSLGGLQKKGSFTHEDKKIKIHEKFGKTLPRIRGANGKRAEQKGKTQKE